MNLNPAPQRWRRVILVSGSPRGGTTWLGRLLSLAENVGYIFEPLTHNRHPQTSQVPALRQFNRTYPHWMLPWPPNGQEEVDHAEVVTRQIEDLFDIYFSAPVDTLIVKQPGIEHFPLLKGVLKPEKSVYIRRHPIAILNSYHKSNLYDAWRIGQKFKLCRDDMQRLRPDLDHILSSAGKDHDRQILAMCCLGHRLAEDWAGAGGLTVIDYENLAMSGPGATAQLLENLSLKLSDQKNGELSRLFAPAKAQKGFYDTEKNSQKRAVAYTTELAPWQLSKARTYLERIGFDMPVPPQNLHDTIVGTFEYSRRGYRALRNSAVARLSLLRNQLLRAN